MNDLRSLGSALLPWLVAAIVTTVLIVQERAHTTRLIEVYDRVWASLDAQVDVFDRTNTILERQGLVPFARTSSSED